MFWAAASFLQYVVVCNCEIMSAVSMFSFKSQKIMIIILLYIKKQSYERKNKFTKEQRAIKCKCFSYFLADFFMTPHFLRHHQPVCTRTRERLSVREEKRRLQQERLSTADCVANDVCRSSCIIITRSRN